MVSSLLVDTLRDPTQSLLDLYDSAKSIDDFPSLVAGHFNDIFRTSDAFNEIPVLNIAHPPPAHAPRALVRFRAMVQDTSPSPEMYLARFTSSEQCCGGWGMEGSEEDHDWSNLRECTILWAVSIPGESEWCGQEADVQSSSASACDWKQVNPHKHPAPGGPQVGVQVKIYDQSNADSYKSTDICTFVGILTSEEPSISNGQNMELASSSEDAAPSFLVPTLHVLFSRPAEPMIALAALPSQLPISDTRTALLRWIADEALGGDIEAAEWVLLATIARVQSRNPAILPPTLTLSHFPSPETESLTTPTLSHVLASLLPLLSYIPLSLELLEKTKFAPESKDEDLHAGALQVPRGSVVLLTDAAVREGVLHDQGVKNVKALQDVVSTQTLSYVFPFSAFSFETDIGVVVLSEGRRSAFVETSIHLPFRPLATDGLYKPKSELRLPPAEQLAAFRALISGAKKGSAHVGEQVSQHIQDDFVRERKADKSVSAEDLVLRMSVARLLAQSMHQTEVTQDIWEMAKAFDKRRLERTKQA